MAEIQRTLSIVKPDATARPGATGEILRRFEEAGLTLLALKKIRLTEELARGFYAVHRKRPFYGDLVKFMTSGPVVVSVLEGPDAIARNRELMGATDSAKAAPGTIRADFGTDIERNAVEIAYFFDAAEILGPVEALADG
jgi:nucleoside-diphosphate kinase